MMESSGIKYARFDQVKLLTTRNVTYLSAPPGSKVSPHGTWQVAGAIDNELLLVKNDVTIRIPVTDVLKVVRYDLESLYAKLGRLSDGEGTEGTKDFQDIRRITEGD